MTLRFLLAAGLLAAPALVSAQSAQRAGLVPTAAVTDLTAPTAAAPADVQTSLLATCTAGETAAQAFVAGATFAEPVGNTAGAGGTPQELGQSFTVPCDGLLSSLSITGQSTVANQQVTLTGSIFNGAGTAGTLLRTATSAFALPAAGAYNLPFTFSPIAVTTGQVITLFIDASSPSVFNLQIVDPGTYAGGTAYISTTGTAAGAAVEGTGVSDIRFTATFGPSTTVTSPQVYNPTSAELDGEGWRLLSSPVGALSVNDLASRNLVQGYAASGGFSAQYPNVASNLLIAYTGTAYLGGEAVPGTEFAPRQGTGYFWYFYDRAITPPPTTSGGGTSTSRELSNFTLSATGVSPAANVSTPYYLTASDGAYMLGNPFARPFQLSGLTQTAPAGGTVGTVFSVWDPAIANYRTLAPTDFIAPWQGVFATSTTVSGAAPTFAFAFASTSTTATPPFYGRSESVANTGIAFTLAGATAAGELHDVAAEVRFVADATAGQDLFDGIKLMPPGAPYALLAPVATVDGAARRFAVNSLPETAEGASVPLAFTTTDAGTFTLTWANTLGDTRSASLRDLATGDVVDLATATEYPFTADAGTWADRFELVLGTRGTTATEATPQAATLSAPTPNPAGARSTLTLRVDAAQTVRVTLVDALGREVAVVFEGSVAPGTDAVLTLDTARLAPGAYVVRVQGETFAESRRVTVAR